MCKKFKCFLFIFIFLFSISSLSVSAETEKIIIGGEPFGLKLYCKGVMITNFEYFECDNSKVCPAQTAGLQLSDIITEVDGKKINSNESIEKIIKKSNGKKINFKILRNDNTLNIAVQPKLKDNKYYCVGIWIRDSCAGIGTISYYDKTKMTYAALGHGICDIDTGNIMKPSTGETLNAYISGISKSTNNNIGSLNGYFTDDIIGSITDNNDLGIYGEVINIPQGKEEYEIADYSEVTEGKATLFTTVDGTIPQKYEIEICRILNYDENSNRNFIVKITDKELLNKTGGIVQGMSGSPIVQNGKFVGALTHVFVESCNQGYGIFAKNMINKTISPCSNEQGTYKKIIDIWCRNNKKYTIYCVNF